MAKKAPLPSFEWLLGLSPEEATRLTGWLYNAAQSKPAIAAEFADFDRWLEKNRAEKAAAAARGR
jgi:maltose-binding protein MalE